MKFLFEKYHSNGNDFIIFDNLQNPKLTVEKAKSLSKMLCKRRYGVGADNVLFLELNKKNTYMHIFNITDIEGDMCGNGSLCVAKYLNDKYKIDKSTIKTRSRKIKTDKLNNEYSAIIGNVSEKGMGIFFKGDKNQLDSELCSLLKEKFASYLLHCGEPHLVIVTKGISLIDIKNLGNHINAMSQLFPLGINLDLVEYEGENKISTRFYERSCFDETESCGTGSTCSAYVVSTYYTNKKEINVTNKTGILKVVLKDRENVLIGNPKKIFTGELEEGDFYEALG